MYSDRYYCDIFKYIAHTDCKANYIVYINIVKQIKYSMQYLYTYLLTKL